MQRFQVHSHSQALTPTHRSLQPVASISVQPFISVEFYLSLVELLDLSRKTYEKNTQWVKEMRKYPDDETFAVGDLVLVSHPLGSVLQSSSKKLNRNWIGPVRIQTVLDNTHHLCSDWNGRLIPKRVHVNRIKQYYMNLGEMEENGQPKIVENVNEL